MTRANVVIDIWVKERVKSAVEKMRDACNGKLGRDRRQQNLPLAQLELSLGVVL